MYTNAWNPPAVWRQFYKMAIKLLDDGLINKIAAGEVIERPASIVKELVENAIDAGSSRINVHITAGGIERIEVVDNGAGIAACDVEMAFQRHATSKITEEADLFHINTMGFRGEALPSIASVSRLELYTQCGSHTGVRAILEGGKDHKIEPFPTAPGTKIIVRDIFFNTPARKKFLKSIVSEGIHIHEVMSKLALSRPDISFSFSNEKKLYFKTPGNNSLRDTVVSIYGHDFADNFFDLEWHGESYALKGIISKPEFRRINRKNQIFFVNNRLVKSPMLARAVDEAYRGLLLSREFPALILFLTVDNEEVDVNVHPQKTEVRFRDEKVVFRLISRGIRDRLDNSSFSGSNLMRPASVFQSLSSNVRTPNYDQGILKAPLQHVSEQYIPFSDTALTANSPIEIRGLDNRDLTSSDCGFAIIGQCFESYILLEKDESLWLVDQHAAHERVMYNRLLDNNALKESHSQLLAFPLAFDLSTAQMDLLEDKMEILREIGFHIEVMGPNAAIIRSAPLLLQGREIEVIYECLELMKDEHLNDLKKEIFSMMACKQAVKAGQSLTRQEMAIIVNEWLQVDNFKNCPHGRPTILELNHLELDKRFKRK